MRFELAMKELRRGFKITCNGLSVGVYLLPRFTCFGRKKRVEVIKMRGSEELIDKRIEIDVLMRDDWRKCE